MSNILTLNQPILFVRYLTWRPPLRNFWILIVCFIIFLLSFYVFQINSLVSEGYLLQTYQNKTEKLIQENERLETSLAEMGSLGNIESLIQGLNFEKISQIHYIQILESQVVTK